MKLVATVLALGAVGCSGLRTSWNAFGLYTALITNEQDPPRQSSGGVSRSGEITTSTRTRLCDIRQMTWQIPSGSSGVNEVGRLAAIAVTLQRPLCEVGADSVVAGYAIVWGHPGADTTLITGIRSSAWSVTGRVTVTEAVDVNPGDPEIGDEVVVQTARGTVSLVAQGPGGRTVRIETGTFELNITERVYHYNPFD